MKKKIIITILVLFGLTFGATQIFGSGIFGWQEHPIYHNSVSNRIAGTLAELTETAEIEKISVWVKRNYDNSYFETAIYDSEGFILDISIGQTLNIGEGWVDFYFTENPVLEPAFYYLISKGNEVNDYGSTNETAYGYKKCVGSMLSGWVNFEDCVSCQTTGDGYAIAIYATYEAVLPPPPPPAPFVETDENFVAGVIGYVRGWLGSGIFPLLAMFIGIPLAFVVIKRVISLVPKK